MYDAEKIRNLAKKRLSEKKYQHTLSVGDEAVKLARIYGADEEKAYVAGLLHDITKEETFDSQLQLCEKYGIVLSEYEMKMPKILHAMTGAGYARFEMNVKDVEILNAIFYHTTGRENMLLLEKIIFLADYVEPLRNFDGVEHVRRYVYENLDQAIFVALSATVEEILEQGGMLCTDTVQARNYLLLHGVSLK